MTAKEYLSQYRLLSAEIDAKLDEAAQIRALAERVTPSDQGGGSGTVSDRVGHSAARLVDLGREIDWEIERLVNLRSEIQEKIEGIEDARGKTILTERYINGKSLLEISRRMNYDYGYICHLHGKFLEIIKKSIQ